MMKFEGARENESGLTLRFGNGVKHSEMVFTEMKPLSLAAVKKLVELTGTDARSDEILNALEL